MNGQNTRMVEALEPSDLRDFDADWYYRMTPQDADSGFNYRIVVYRRGGRRIASSYADTKWGSRHQAHVLRRRYCRRSQMTSETRAF